MRQKNWRVVIVGGVLIGLALVFVLVMMSLAPQSTDPQALMETVGATAGVVIGVSVAMIIYGLIGKKT
ncbi:MAG: hypothetical protein JNK07_00165 [Alphaproteobacteria bacterium]|nr:hypothetical protein [Alphaproteobacteria bacterium]